MTAHILVVEDDPVSREVLASLIGSLGHSVDTAEDGFGALKLAQETAYDLVFVDYHLPEMDGYALARLMRSLAEKTRTPLNMVAITADRFGLAARRGVDSIFDRVLAKPIEPEVLFALVDEFLGDALKVEELEAFLGEPEGQGEARDAGRMLWRARGVAELPSAAVFPAPTPNERAGLAQCFRLVDAAQADCLILLKPSGLEAVEALRKTGTAYLKPLVTIDPKLAAIGDAHFEVGDGDSWTAVARLLAGFADRRGDLQPGMTNVDVFDTRLLAYLHVSDRALELCRDAAGATIVPYTAGFPVRDLIEAVKRLAARGFISARFDDMSSDGKRRIIASVAAKGAAFVASPSIGLSAG